MIDRIKREVSSSIVEKGVNERVRLAQIYEKKTEELEKQHEEIRQNFNDLKNKVSIEIVSYKNSGLIIRNYLSEDIDCKDYQEII